MKQYLFNINNISPQQAEQCLSLMSDSRKKYINSISNKKRRNESIAGEWLLRNAVSQFCGIESNEIKIERTDKGKPYIKDTDIFVSLSHSGDFVAVAVDYVPIGIDIEVIKPLNLRVAHKVCSESDKRFILTGETEEQRLINFLKIWTAKEAYFKKTGTGITHIKELSYKDIKALHFINENILITVVN